MDAFIKEFLATFDDNQFPGDFLQQYELLECLSHNEQGETLLCKDWETGSYCVAKCYSEKALLPITIDTEVLKKLDHKGLPAFRRNNPTARSSRTKIYRCCATHELLRDTRIDCAFL